MNSGTGALCAASSSAAATQALAAAIAAALVDGDLLVMAGDLGAGKTCFTQGLGRGLEVEDRITSPTFTLAGRYEGQLTLNHLDVYRLDDVSETLDLDLPELLEDGVTVIEWGEQIVTALPDDLLVVRIEFGDGDDDRRFRFECRGSWAGRLAELAAAVREWTVPC